MQCTACLLERQALQICISLDLVVQVVQIGNMVLAAVEGQRRLRWSKKAALGWLPQMK
jgi:hypothetical protein